MAWQPPMVNQISADISSLSIYLRSTRGLLVGCGGEIGYSLLDNLNYTQVETYQDLVDLGNWLVTKKGIEHNIEMIAFDTVDELVIILLFSSSHPANK